MDSYLFILCKPMDRVRHVHAEGTLLSFRFTHRSQPENTHTYQITPIPYKLHTHHPPHHIDYTYTNYAYIHTTHSHIHHPHKTTHTQIHTPLICTHIHHLPRTLNPYTTKLYTYIHTTHIQTPLSTHTHTRTFPPHHTNYTHIYTQPRMFNQLSGHPVFQSS